MDSKSLQAERKTESASSFSILATSLSFSKTFNKGLRSTVTSWRLKCWAVAGSQDRGLGKKGCLLHGSESGPKEGVLKCRKWGRQKGSSQGRGTGPSKNLYPVPRMAGRLKTELGHQRV